MVADAVDDGEQVTPGPTLAATHYSIKILVHKALKIQCVGVVPVSKLAPGDIAWGKVTEYFRYFLSLGV